MEVSLAGIIIAPGYQYNLAGPASLGDVNEDGPVDIVDALLIAQYYVGLISVFC